MSKTNKAGPLPVRRWVERTGWLWQIIGGLFLIAYLFWYIPALVGLPNSLRDPPEPYPWHWTLDFLATAVSGSLLLYLGLRRGLDLATERVSVETDPLPEG